MKPRGAPYDRRVMRSSVLVRGGRVAAGAVLGTAGVINVLIVETWPALDGPEEVKSDVGHLAQSLCVAGFLALAAVAVGLLGRMV